MSISLDKRKNTIRKLDNIQEKGIRDIVYDEEFNKFKMTMKEHGTVEACNRCDSKFAISMNSGTDALTIAMHLLGVRRGDEVITPPNSFIASTATIVHLGAKPVFADVLKDMNINPDEVGRKKQKKPRL